MVQDAEKYKAEDEAARKKVEAKNSLENCEHGCPRCCRAPHVDVGLAASSSFCWSSFYGQAACAGFLGLYRHVLQVHAVTTVVSTCQCISAI